MSPSRTRSRRKRGSERKRTGRVSYYSRHGAWHVYYRDGARVVRRRVADNEADAKIAAANISAQLSAAMPTVFSFQEITVQELRRKFLEHHEHVSHSSVATVKRYRAATQHLVDFCSSRGSTIPAHHIQGEEFLRYLRRIKVSPNGHSNARRRPLREKGIRFILETCRSLYTFAAKRRHLPPYSENPFIGLASKRGNSADAKQIFVFDAKTELAFFRAADAWEFAVHFTLAKTGLRPGELVHLLVEDVDLDAAWLWVRNKPELGWCIKTGRERRVPVVSELVSVLRHVIAQRQSGVLFQRRTFDPGSSRLTRATRKQLALAVETATAQAETKSNAPLPREMRHNIAKKVWRAAGAVSPDQIRQSYARIMSQLGYQDATCPKSWRHTFATLLQDALVDPLVRQITLGHAPNDATGGLGMTALYTHTRAETHRREIERALRLWPDSLSFATSWCKEATNADQ